MPAIETSASKAAMTKRSGWPCTRPRSRGGERARCAWKAEAAAADPDEPTIDLDGSSTRVLVEQTTAVSPDRLGESVGRLSASELRDLDIALALVIGLRAPSVLSPA